MNNLPKTTRLQFAQPCPAVWKRMGGDKHCRRCGLCQQSVFDLESLPETKVEDLLPPDSNATPKKLFQRGDGKFMERDCPMPIAVAHPRQGRWRSWAAASLSVVLMLGTLTYGFLDDIRKVFGASIQCELHDCPRPSSTHKVALPTANAPGVRGSRTSATYR
jgi:hypothetical protein